MYVVIFRAQVRQFDAEYSAMANQLRELALTQYGCLEFQALSEGEHEIALSYWPDLASIKQWREMGLHLEAQAKGRQEWYSSYQIDIAKVERRYSASNTPASGI